MKSSVFIVAVLLLTARGAFAAGQPEKKDDAMMMEPAMEKSDSMMLKDPVGFYSTQRMQPYVMPFTTPEAAQAYAVKGPTAYFFAATWCPNCQAAYKDLERNFRKMPEGMTLVLVNFDKTPDLKSRYAVTIQHTFIQINEKGEKVKAWVGSNTVSDIVKRIEAM
jgi:thiol-disulfide isomerase/thioredoxin